MKIRIAIVAASFVLGAAAVHADQPYIYTISLAGGAAGAYDVRPSSNFGAHSFQLGASLVTSEDTLLALRLGKVHFGKSSTFDPFAKVDLDYVTLGGEYRFKQSYYDFGFYLGLGGYKLDGTFVGGGTRQHTAPGVALGATGDFDLTRHFSIITEVSLHYAFLKEADVFAMLHAGVAFHF